VASGQSSCVPGTIIAASTDTQHMQTGLTPAATYFWSVSAVDMFEGQQALKG
jgi:hypothetical protein